MAQYRIYIFILIRSCLLWLQTNSQLSIFYHHYHSLISPMLKQSSVKNDILWFCVLLSPSNFAMITTVLIPVRLHHLTGINLGPSVDVKWGETEGKTPFELQQIWHEFLPSINWLTGIYWVLKGLQVCVYCVVYIDNRIVFDTNTYAQLQFFSSNGSNLFSVTSSENVPTQPKLLSTLPLIDKDEKQYTGQIKVLFLSTARPITTQHQWCLLWLIYFA
jgi:hypothetical protein